MKISAVLILAGLMLCSYAYAQEERPPIIAEVLSNELEQEGVAKEDVGAIKNTIKEMLDQGASKEEIKSVVSDLNKKGVKGAELKESVDSVNNLVKEGEDIKEAGNIVSKAAHAAKAEGLKGKDLAAKVHEAIQQRKQERDALKAQKKEIKEELKQEKAQKKVQEKVKVKEQFKEMKTEKLKGIGKGNK